MGGTKGGEAVSSAAGKSLCDVWCGLVCGYHIGRRLSRTGLFYGCPLLRTRIFPFLLRLARSDDCVDVDVGSARAARLEREGGARKGEGGPGRLQQGRKAHRLDLIV